MIFVNKLVVLNNIIEFYRIDDLLKNCNEWIPRLAGQWFKSFKIFIFAVIYIWLSV